MFVVNIFKRSFNSNLKTVTATEAERSSLFSAGVQQATVQNYLAWRRGLLAFVVIASTAGIVVDQYRQWTEEESGIDIFETLQDHFSSAIPPGLDIEKAKTDLQNQAQEKIDEAKENLPDASEVEAKVRDAIEENNPTNENPSEEKPDEQDSTGPDLSIPGSQDGAKDEPIPPDDTPKTFLSHNEDIIHNIAFYGIPVAALAAMILWTRYKISSTLLLVAFAFSFMLPILLAFAPWSWWDGAEAILPANATPEEKLEHTVAGLAEGAAYLAALLPTLLSLIPGIQKACLRVKTLLPQSILPGWFLVTISPFYALFLLIVFIAINQVLSTPLFFTGMILFIAAPLIYVIRAKVFTAPLATPEDYRRMLLTQKMVGGLTALAGVLLLVFLISKTSGDIMGLRLYGLDAKTALLTPMDLVEFLIQTLSRGMFMTVLGADILMKMNLSAWKNSHTFEGTKEAAEYDDVMKQLRDSSVQA